MAIQATFQQLQRVVADEIGDRTDLLSPLSDSGLAASPIVNAIYSAIAKWEREPLYFNQAYQQNVFSTVKGQEFYTAADYPAIATVPLIDKVHILINANRYTLNFRTWQYLELISVNPQVTSQPIDIAYYNEELRLYPIPDNAYPLTFSWITRLAALVNNTDTNAWTQDAYDLIRSEAKLILAEEVLHDPDLAAECQRSIYGDPNMPARRGYLYAVKAETARREGRGKIIPSHF